MHWLWRWWFVGGSIFLLTVSYAQSGQSEIAGFGCLIRRLTGILMPSCGLTRSLLASAHGDWGQAIKYHLFGPLLLLSAWLILGLTLVECCVGIALSLPLFRWLGKHSTWFTGLLIYFTYYGLRLYFYYWGDIDTPIISELMHNMRDQFP